MPTFEYESLGGSAGAGTAVIDAPDRAAAVRMLRQQGITPVRVEEVSRKGRWNDRKAAERGEAGAGTNFAFQPGRSSAARPGQSSKAAGVGAGRPAMTKSEMASFIRELATAVMAGLPLMQALKTIARQGRSSRQKAMLEHMIGEVEHGRSLGDAASSWGKPFTELTISLIRAGEVSGRLGEVLDQAANLLDREAKMRRTLMAGLLYPGILAALIAIAIVVISTVIVPSILEPLKSQMQSVTLPLPTRIVTGTVEFLTAYWYIIVGLATVLVLWIVKALRTPSSRLSIDAGLLKVPLLGRVLRDVAVARFTRTLCTLVSAGLPALTALRSTKATLGNKAMEKVVEEVCEQVSAGKTIAEPMERSGYFPPLLTQIVGVGERSGRLPQMLSQAANVFEDRTETSIKVFTTVFPPMLVIVAAIVVGFVIMAILLPLLQLQDMIR
ncbi:MAG: type II secretion system F family protein [Phycisphaerales bacterium]